MRRQVPCQNPHATPSAGTVSGSDCLVPSQAVKAEEKEVKRTKEVRIDATTMVPTDLYWSMLRAGAVAWLLGKLLTEILDVAFFQKAKRSLDLQGYCGK